MLVLLSALVWLVAALVCAAVIAACGRLLFWQQLEAPGAMVATLALIMAGVSAMRAASTPLPGLAPLDAATPVRVLFFLSVCVFPRGRLVWRETRWLLIFFAFVVLTAPFPLSPATAVPQILPTVLQELAIAVAIAPQLTPHHLSAVAGRLRGARIATCIAGGVAGSLAVLAITIWLAMVTNPQPPLFVARMGWDLVVSLVPASLGLALLHGRVYDRAALTRRALIYGLLSGVLVLVYVVGVHELAAPLQSMLKPQTPRLAEGPPLAANLLAILAMVFLFQPLRHALNEGVDRRFYPRLHDAARAVSAFTALVYEEIDVAALGRRILALLQATLHPRRATLWVRVHLSEDTAPPRDSGLGRGPGRGHDLPVQRPIELARCAQLDEAALDEPALVIGPADPILPALLQGRGPLALQRLPAASEAASRLRADGMDGVVPLVDRDEVVGLIALRGWWPPFDMRELVAALAEGVAPALRIAQRIHEQEAQTRQRERVEQELQLAQRIQRSFLPHDLPALDGWHITPHYQPAREVGGDFYDVLTLTQGRLGLIVGDVTGKGIPAALVMAAARSMLRAAAQQQDSPASVLAQVNDLLCPDMPPGMFVTCFYAILDPPTGQVRFANAGHELPYHRQGERVTELFATGMPLGLLPDRRYDEGAAILEPGDTLFLYSDGLVEAHNRRRDMFGHARVARLVGEMAGDTAPIERVLSDLAGFTAPEWEQEDDIMLVAVQRHPITVSDETRMLAAWSLPSVRGNERQAMVRVRQALEGLPMSEERATQLETAVAEATLNAMEHGNGYQAEQTVEFQVLAAPTTVTVRIGDQGSGPLELPAAAPDLTAKLAGEQSPRGWGLFLMTQLVDEVRVTASVTDHTIELSMALSAASPI